MVKGFAIFLMIWSHTLLYSMPANTSYFDLPVGQFIGSINMPILMLISGYLFYFSFSKRELSELIVHRCRPLLYTIAFYGLVHYFLTHGIINLLKGHLTFFFNGVWITSLYAPFWFLIAVLSSSLVVAFICKKISNLWLQIPLLIIASIVILAFPSNTVCLFVYPYYVIGFYYAKYKDNLKFLNKFKYVSLLLYPIMMLFFKSEHFIYTSGFLSSPTAIGFLKIDLYRWAVGLIGSVFLLTLFELFYKFITLKFMQQNKKEFFSLALNELGDNSLQYYVISVTMVSFWFQVCYKWLSEKFTQISIFMDDHLWLHNFVFTLFLTILFCVFLYIIIKYINGTKLNAILFGKPQKTTSTNEKGVFHNDIPLEQKTLPGNRN